MNQTESIDRMFEIASQHYQSGQLQLAEEIYIRILQIHPDHLRALHAIGVIAFQKGMREKALEFINKALFINNDYADAHNSLGNILLSQGRIEEAAASYRHALAIKPDSAVTLSNLGNALKSLGDVDEAIDCYLKALDIRPDITAAHLGLGIAYRDTGRLDDALKNLDRVISLMPGSAEAHFLLGTVLEGKGKSEGAAECYQRAISFKPDFADARNNLGNLLALQGQMDEARGLFRKAVEIKPDFFLAHNNLGNVLTEMGCYEEAAESYRKAVEINSSYAEAYSNLGNVLSILDRDVEALTACLKAVELEPDAPDSLKNLGDVLASMDRIDEAVAFYQKAIVKLSWDPCATGDVNRHPPSKASTGKIRIPLAADIHFALANALRDQSKFEEAASHYQQAIMCMPDFAMAYNNLGNVRKDQGRLNEALECYRKGLETSPECTEVHSNLLFAMNYSDRFSVKDILDESLRWERYHGLPRAHLRKPFDNSADSDKKIKVGYVSADFGRHPVGYFLLPVLKAHDHDRFEIYCFSGRAQEDEITLRLRSYADCWRSTLRMGDEELAEQIRTDCIDILVDLSGHTAGNRLPVLSMKPAPIQVTWAGYVGTTGLSSIDYLISDYQETPEGVDDLYVEKIIRLPGDYICYEPPSYAPPVSPLPMLYRKHPTFGCFNNLNKVSESVVELWSQLLLRLPTARLLLATGQLDDASTRDLYRHMFNSHGVAERVDLCGSLPHRELLSRYNDIDIALDPFPYSGGLTTLESLWMGVPVITKRGDRFAGRHSLTHLTNVGEPGLIVDTLGEYIEIAVSLADDPLRLQELRQELRPRMAASLICDGTGFTRNLEKSYEDMWRSWCTEGRG